MSRQMASGGRFIRPHLLHAPTVIFEMMLFHANLKMKPSKQLLCSLSDTARQKNSNPLPLPLHRHPLHQPRQRHPLWLPPVQDRLYHLRRQQRQPQHPADVGLVHLLGLGEFADRTELACLMLPTLPMRRRERLNQDDVLAHLWRSKVGRTARRDTPVMKTLSRCCKICHLRDAVCTQSR